MRWSRWTEASKWEIDITEVVRLDVKSSKLGRRPCLPSPCEWWLVPEIEYQPIHTKKILGRGEHMYVYPTLAWSQALITARPVRANSFDELPWRNRLVANSAGYNMRKMFLESWSGSVKDTGRKCVLFYPAPEQCRVIEKTIMASALAFLQESPLTAFLIKVYLIREEGALNFSHQYQYLCVVSTPRWNRVPFYSCLVALPLVAWSLVKPRNKWVGWGNQHNPIRQRLASWAWTRSSFINVGSIMQGYLNKTH